MQIDQAKIEAAIVEQAVERFSNEDDLYARVKRGVEARIDALFADQVTALITDKITEITKEGFEREYVKRDGFGKPVGQPTSISKELETILSGYWTQRVNSRGDNVGNGAYNSVSRAEWTMSKICADEFSKELRQHVVNVSGALKDQFRAVLNDHVSTLLHDVFKVKSIGDSALKNPGMSSIQPPAKPIVES